MSAFPGAPVQRGMEEPAAVSASAEALLSEDVPWVPRMDAIRKAQMAEVEALEQIMEALSSKQQSSLSKLCRQVDSILAWKSQLSQKDRTEMTSRSSEAAIATAEVASAENLSNSAGNAAFINLNGGIMDRPADQSEVEQSGWVLHDGGVKQAQIVTLNEDAAFLMHRVAALERDLVKLKGLWDMNKGHRIIEVWMGLLKKKSYKPSNIDDPVECAAITLQNWWREVLDSKLEENSSSGSSTSSREEDKVRGTCKDVGAHEEDRKLPASEAEEWGEDAPRPRRREEHDASRSDDETDPPSSADDSTGRQPSRGGSPTPSSVRFHGRALYGTPPESEDGSGVSHKRLSTAGIRAAIPPELSRSKDVTPNPGFGTTPVADNGRDMQQQNELDRGMLHQDDLGRGRPPLEPSRGHRDVDERAVIADTAQCPRQSPAKATSSATAAREVQQRERHVQDAFKHSSDQSTLEIIPATQLEKSTKEHRASVVETPPAEERISSSASPQNREPHHHQQHPKTLDMNSERRNQHRRHHQQYKSNHHQAKDRLHHKDSEATEPNGGVQGMFNGSRGESPVLMFTSMAMQLQSQETVISNLRRQVIDLEECVAQLSSREWNRGEARASRDSQGSTDAARNPNEHAQPEQQHPDTKISREDFIEMGRSLGELQRELGTLRDREEGREKRTEHSLEELEALIFAKDQDTDRRFQEQAKENAETIDKLLARIGSAADDEKARVVREALVELKSELRSLYSSIDAVSGNEISANQLRSLEGIRHLLANFSQQSRELEAEIGDPLARAKDIVAGNVSARQFADTATKLGTTLFAFIKAQVLQARRAREGSLAAAARVHRRASSPEAAAAVVDANLAGGNRTAAGADGDGAASATGASPEAWAKLSYLTYTRDRTSEKVPFPAGMVVLLKALSEVLNHCVGTGDLAIRLSVTLEDLTVYVAQRADKERESITRQLSGPVDAVKDKLGEMEQTLAGFERTMHLVLSEVDADRERSAAIAALGMTVKNMQGLFSRLKDDLESKAGASEIEKALEDMTFKINQTANEQTRLQRLGRALGNDHNSSTPMKRLQIELEQARAVALLSMASSDQNPLIGSKCLSCNRPLGGFSLPQTLKGHDEWFTGAGSLGGPKDRVLEVAGKDERIDAGGSSSGAAGGGGRGSGSGNAGIGSSRPPGRTQPVMTPAKILPLGSASASSESPGTLPKKSLQGPLLFERTGSVGGAGGAGGVGEAGGAGGAAVVGLKGRVLRGGGGGGGSLPADANASISKYPRLVPLTAPKSAPASGKLYQTNTGGATTAATTNGRRA